MKFRTLFFSLFFLLFLYSPAISSSAQKNAGGPHVKKSNGLVLKIGKVTSQPKKHFQRFKELAAFLADNLEDAGVSDVEVLFARNNEEMIEFLKQGEIDIISETLFSTMLYREETGIDILLREWRNNVPEYHTVFFTRKDSDIKELADLQSRILAFEDPGSTSAYFLPRTVLSREGYRFVKMGWPGPESAKVPSNRIGYVFAKTEDNIPIWVHEGRVHAGVLSNTDWVDKELVPPAIKKDLRIFHETEPVPRSLLSARKGLPKNIRTQIKQLLLNTYGDKQPSGIIQKFSRVTNYDEVPSKEVQRFKSLFDASRTAEKD